MLGQGTGSEIIGTCVYCATDCIFGSSMLLAITDMFRDERRVRFRGKHASQPFSQIASHRVFL
jgi:hypothetical protein